MIPSRQGVALRGRLAALAANAPTLNLPQKRKTTTRPVFNAMTPAPALVLVAFLVLFGMLGPVYLVFSITSGMTLAMVALGLLIVVGWAREISLLAAGIFASAIYLDGYLNREVGRAPGWPWVWAALTTIGVIAIGMALVAMSSARLPGIYMVVLTLGAQVIIERTVYANGLLSGGLGGGDQDGFIIVNRRPMIFGWNVGDATDREMFFLIAAVLCLVLIAMARLRHCPMGLAFHLVGADRQAAAAVGISPFRFRVYAFTASGILAAIAGILANWLFRSPPSFTNYLSPYSLFLLAIPVLAGLDSIAFTMIVAISFEVVPVVVESLRINTYLLGAAGLIGGALFGSRGAGGRFQDEWKYILYGSRAHRIGTSIDATAMRSAQGLASEHHDTHLSTEQRNHALDLLENWLPARPDTDVAIAATNIEVLHGSVKALRGASITVPAGSMCGLLGPNGAGKTTLFDVISGLRRPNAGTVSLFGTDVTATTGWDRAKLGMCRTFQTTRVMDDLTVADNLLAGVYQRIHANTALFLLGHPKAWRELRSAEDVAFAAAQLLNIDRYWNERVATLEFSARRRTEIGRCLLTAPRLLLLDEPAAGLDPASSAALFALIKQLHEDLGLTVLLVEHYVKAVLDSCDLVYVLAEGNILASGTPNTVANDPEVRNRYLGTRINYSTTTNQTPATETEAGPVLVGATTTVADKPNLAKPVAPPLGTGPDAGATTSGGSPSAATTSAATTSGGDRPSGNCPPAGDSHPGAAAAEVPGSTDSAGGEPHKSDKLSLAEKMKAMRER